MLNLLHLDDDLLFLHRCAGAFRKSPLVAHIHYSPFSTPDDFKSAFASMRPAAVLLDLSFAGHALRGLEVLREIRSSGYTGVVVMMSALTSADIIMECIRAGATDFLSKGLDESELTFRIARLIRAAGMANSAGELNAPLLPAHISGRSMREIQQRLLRVSKSAVKALLVTGESGTGKEMVAETLRQMVPQGTPFISVNCAALAPALIEAEIFGHEKGAFTGAAQARIGLFEAADGGWLFLDEVARLSTSAQASLLRALESGEVRPVGSTRTRKVSVRVIAATNEELDTLVENNQFRADLLTRLRGYEIHLPPFRERSLLERQEIIECLLARLNQNIALDAREFRLTESCLTVLSDLHWQQGNVRELWQTLQAMSVDALDGIISLETLPRRYLNISSAAEGKSAPASAPIQPVQITTANNRTPSGIGSINLGNLAFPCDFELLQEELFSCVLAQLRNHCGEQEPSQRTIAQLLNISRHEAAQRMARQAPAR